MTGWTDGYWESADGLRLHYRDYAGGGAKDDGRPPILCIPGLTRNARDFEGVAERLAGKWRVICVELRGRGESGYAKDPMTYVPPVYLQDLDALIAELKLDRFVAFGTSLGGLLIMLLAAANADRIAGVLLNDVGPVVEPRGVEHIRSYVGRARDWPTWLHAARFIAEAQADRYPDWEIDQWLVYAKRLCKLTPAGRIVYDYDMRIAEPFKLAGDEAAVDLWPYFRALAKVPALVIRGEHSDILGPETAEKMLAEAPLMERVLVPRVGHAPTLDEPEAIAGIDRLLKRVKARRS
jgi:pimeloyl-ACP methyl ester carboxylesterase